MAGYGRSARSPPATGRGEDRAGRAPGDPSGPRWIAVRRGCSVPEQIRQEIAEPEAAAVAEVAEAPELLDRAEHRPELTPPHRQSLSATRIDRPFTNSQSPRAGRRRCGR